jgi:glycosyltransferase involved in cell wall biosynthesis
MQAAGTPPFLRQTVVVIPALNEAACVAATVESWRVLGAARVRVVDNGSTDDTAVVAKRAGAEVLSEPLRGYGAAVWRGLQNWPEGMNWVLFSSADGSDRLFSEDLVAWQGAADSEALLIVGDRMTISASRSHLNLTQRLGNWMTCQVIRVHWGHRFHDMGSLRLVRHAALMQLGLVDRGFGWNVEMQIRAIEHGWRIIELPVRYCPRVSGESKISGSFAGTLRAGHGIVRMLVWLCRLPGSTSCRAAGQAVRRCHYQRP